MLYTKYSTRGSYSGNTLAFQAKARSSILLPRSNSRKHMDMDQAAVFLAGSVLTALGFIAVAIGIVVINNIIARFWRPVRIFTEDSWKGFGVNAGFADSQDVEKTQEPSLTKK